MFQSCLLPLLVATVLLIHKITDESYQKDDIPPDSPILTSLRPVTLPTQFMCCMKLHMGKAKGPVCRNKLVLLYLCSLLLAESYAPEPNPGPRAPKFPCAICEKACKWTTPCVCCDSCDSWYHQDCMGMSDIIFKALANCSWECISCGMPNYSTCIFDTTLFDTSNSFSTLSETSHSDKDISFSCPNATSSPRQPPRTNHPTENRHDLPLRVLMVNCQSIKTPGKKGQLENMLLSSHADIVIGTESWLDNSISSSEVFPDGYKCYRRDREVGSKGGGVFILVLDTISSSEPVELSPDGDCELAWTKIHVKGAQDLYVGACYKPPSRTENEYLDLLSTSLSRVPRGAHLWLGGDFNLADINWVNECTNPQATNRSQCQQLIDITRDAYLEQVVDKPMMIQDPDQAQIT